MRLRISQHIPLLIDHFIIFTSEVDQVRLTVTSVELNTSGTVRYNHRPQYALSELRVVVNLCIKRSSLNISLGFLLASLLVYPGNLALVKGSPQLIPAATEPTPAFTGGSHQRRLQRDVIFD